VRNSAYPNSTHTETSDVENKVIVAWTGHRPDVFDDPLAAETAVHQAAAELAGVAARFLVGGQRGVDMWAAMAAISFGLPYVLILPHAPDVFAAEWPAEDRAVLDHTLQNASAIDVADDYSERNRLLATSADLLVAVWTGTRGGGTEETIAFARQAGVPVREIRLRPARGAEVMRGRGI
jgi:hypothetical protein